MIGEEIKYDYDAVKSLKWFTWFCSLLAIIVFSFLAYVGLVEQEISLGGGLGLNISHYSGSKAVAYGYFFFSCAFSCFAAGYWYHRFKFLIWLVIAIIWGCGLVYIHGYVT